MRPNNFLLTGLPGCGKSTIIEKIVQGLNLPSTGFFTREMREKGRRVGFSISTLDGGHGIMAHVHIRSPRRVGRYGIDVQTIDRLAVPSMVPKDGNMVIVVDEIGKMECLSALFRQTLIQVLESPNTVVGSIALKGDAFISAIKRRPDTCLLPVSPENRNHLADKIFALLPKG